MGNRLKKRFGNILQLTFCLFILQIQQYSHAQETRFQNIEFSTELVPGIVEVGVLTPKGYSESEDSYPLILLLHGGGGNSVQLDERFRETIQRAWDNGVLPPAVIVTPSARRSFYLDYKDGSQSWETFVLSELIPRIRENFNVRTDSAGTVITGISMGGLGALRIAFKNPSQFSAVAVMEPAMEPAYSFDDIEEIDRTYRSEELYEELFGQPVDRGYWQQNHPLYIARENLEILKQSGLQIYFEVGNKDRLNLFRGAETLHRLFYDNQLDHEYRVVHGADHTGDSIAPRLYNTMNFVGRVLNGGFGPE